MKGKSFLILCFLGFVIAGCQSRYTFWEISKFNMNSLALTDGEEIKLIYTSQGPDNNKDLSYYIHLIAISQKTGDTVNILTTTNNGFAKTDGDEVFNFFGQEHLASLLMQTDLSHMNELGNIEDLKNGALSKITRVARDIKFDDIADNNFPTVIGYVGTMRNSPN